MRAGIVGLGLWTPDAVRGNDAWSPDFVRGFHEHREARRNADFTEHGARQRERPYDDVFVEHAGPHESDPFKGTLERRVADPAVPTSVGDTIAAQRALDDARLRADDVDLILSSALPQDKLCPSNAPAIAEGLGCRAVASVGVESYCASPIVQLDMAAALVASGRARNVLCVQSHQVARINDLRLPASPIFGDASGAFVVGRVPDERGVVGAVRAGDPSLRNGVALSFPENPRAIWWQGSTGPVVPGSDDFDAAKTVAQNLLKYPADTITDLLAESGVPVDAVAAFSMIQPTAWFQPAIAKILGVSPSRFPSTHARFAHIGGAAIAANLLEARRSRLLSDGSPVVVYAHGAGFTRYAILLRWYGRDTA